MPETPQWQPCPDGVPLECTSVQVPLDYQHPDGAKIGIEVSRHKATGRRRGVLLMNPGGPGAPGILMPLQVALPKSVTDEYDLIGFDPRGTGHSAPDGLIADPVTEAKMIARSTPRCTRSARIVRCWTA